MPTTITVKSEHLATAVRIYEEVNGRLQNAPIDNDSTERAAYWIVQAFLGKYAVELSEKNLIDITLAGNSISDTPEARAELRKALNWLTRRGFLYRSKRSSYYRGPRQTYFGFSLSRYDRKDD